MWRSSTKTWTVATNQGLLGSQAAALLTSSAILVETILWIAATSLLVTAEDAEAHSRAKKS